jgi:hypothetical protein
MHVLTCPPPLKSVCLPPSADTVTWVNPRPKVSGGKYGRGFVTNVMFVCIGDTVRFTWTNTPSLHSL